MQIRARRRYRLDRVMTKRPAATGPAKLVSSQRPISESPRNTPLAPKPQSATPGVNWSVNVSPRRSTPVLRGLGSKQDICRPSNGVKSRSMLERTASPLAVESVSRSRPCTSRSDPRSHPDRDPGARRLSSRNAMVQRPARESSGLGSSPPAAGASAVRQPATATMRQVATHRVGWRVMRRLHPAPPRRPRCPRRRLPSTTTSRSSIRRRAPPRSPTTSPIRPSHR
jgi:hypothetical protein